MLINGGTLQLYTPKPECCHPELQNSAQCFVSKGNEQTVPGKIQCKPQQKVNRKGQKMAPYCITMLLTPDYGEGAKGKPEAPKARTPHYCTGQSRASRLVNNTQRVQDSPFDNKKTPMLGPGPTSPEGEGQAHRPTRPSGLGVTGATGRGPPTIRILKPIRSQNSEIPIRVVTSGCTASTSPIRSGMLEF